MMEEESIARSLEVHNERWGSLFYTSVKRNVENLENGVIYIYYTIIYLNIYKAKVERKRVELEFRLSSL